MRATYRITGAPHKILTDILSTPEKFDDRFIIPRPFGVCPRPFAVTCCDMIRTPTVRYTALCVFDKACRLATVAGSPPLYRLFPITWEQGVLTAVHEHNGKRIRTLIGFQVITSDTRCTGSNRRRNMFGAIEKRDGPFTLRACRGCGRRA